MQTLVKDGIYKPKTIFNLSVFSPPDDPTCFSEAQKHFIWRAAMADEFNALLSNQTWDLVPWDDLKNVVGYRLYVRATVGGAPAARGDRLGLAGPHWASEETLWRFSVSSISTRVNCT
ncbi:unnamed protein product [Cuscuta epithymum]|uniref:Uncharacterized protein n=1 Tax=Cuscuta epithymum TaxID=186058 RepID=A0AAV0C5A5_9ASTE|nr:unnamed protein product [Cuscuta epithymum]